MNDPSHKTPASKILIAEDQQDILENLSDYLSMQGYEVLQAKNGRQAFSITVEQQPDLIISDLGMPEWDGHRLLQAIQEDSKLARIPFIILTAWSDRSNMRKGLQDGAVDYITKPFTLAEIDEAVKSHLGRKQRLEQSVQHFAMSEVIPAVLRHLPHELRTPMNGILAPSEMLMEADAEVTPKEVAQLGEIINASGLRLLRVVENMSLFLSLQSLKQTANIIPTEKIQITHPQILFERIREKAITRHSSRTHNLQTKGFIANNLGVANDFEKVFEEILDNACHFAAANSEILITWEHQADSGTLTIENQGPGLTPEHINSIDSFKQFERKKREQQGLGLGLFIARELARHNGGAVDIQSKPEGPTKVTIRFGLHAL